MIRIVKGLADSILQTHVQPIGFQITIKHISNSIHCISLFNFLLNLQYLKFYFFAKQIQHFSHDADSARVRATINQFLFHNRI